MHPLPSHHQDLLDAVLKHLEAGQGEPQVFTNTGVAEVTHILGRLSQPDQQQQALCALLGVAQSLQEGGSPTAAQRLMDAAQAALAAMRQRRLALHPTPPTDGFSTVRRAPNAAPVRHLVSPVPQAVAGGVATVNAIRSRQRV